MNDFYAELLSKDRIKTFHTDADNYRQVKNAFPVKTNHFSSILILWQQVWRRLKSRRNKHPQARG